MAYCIILALFIIAKVIERGRWRCAPAGGGRRHAGAGARNHKRSRKVNRETGRGGDRGFERVVGVLFQSISGVKARRLGVCAVIEGVCGSDEQ